MPTCESQRGFSYLLLIFGVALGGAALAALGPQWQAALQREREAELIFRGLEFKRALQSYQARKVGNAPALPERLDELLHDRRGEAPVYHLRRLYLDPFTGQADWVLLTDDNGRIRGLHSRSQAVAYRRENVPASVEKHPGQEPRVGDWVFAVEPAASAASAPGSAATAAPAANGSPTDNAGPRVRSRANASAAKHPIVHLHPAAAAGDNKRN